MAAVVPPHVLFFGSILKFLLVHGVPLDPTQRVEFFRDILGPLARSIPFGIWFIRVVDGVDLKHPVEAAKGRRVFELNPLR